MKTLPIDDHNQGMFFHKLERFFPIFEKGQRRPTPLSPLVTRLRIRDVRMLRPADQIFLRKQYFEF